METSVSMAAAIKLGTRPSPPPRHRLTALESQHRLTKLTQHAAHESKTKFTLFYAKGHSAQPDMFWTTHHTEPYSKIDAGDASLFMRSIN
jgi:hypothetical protein